MFDYNTYIPKKAMLPLTDDELKTEMIKLRAIIDSKERLRFSAKLPLAYMQDILIDRKRSQFNRKLYSKLLNQIEDTAEAKMSGAWHYGKYDLSLAVDWLLDNYDIKEK